MVATSRQLQAETVRPPRCYYIAVLRLRLRSLCGQRCGRRGSLTWRRRHCFLRPTRTHSAVFQKKILLEHRSPAKTDPASARTSLATLCDPKHSRSRGAHAPRARASRARGSAISSSTSRFHAKRRTALAFLVDCAEAFLRSCPHSHQIKCSALGLMPI